MSKALLTIIDEDPHTLELVRRILEQADYRIDTATSARKALVKLEEAPPDLIITELELKDMPGFGILQKLHQHPALQEIPVMVLSTRRNADDKLKARELGARAYVVKPFQRQDFLMRVKMLLQARRSSPKHPSNGKIASRLVLDKLKEHQLQEIQPQIDKASSSGYNYLNAVSFLQFQDNRHAITTFDKMVESGWLKKKLFDVVHLCPYCRQHAINFREVCPACHSLNIALKMFYLHTKCGSQTVHSDQKDLKTLHCSGCGLELSSSDPNIEIDYAFHCGDCGKDFNEININCRCLGCGETFDVSEAVKQQIFSYQITPQITEPPKALPGATRLTDQTAASTLLLRVLETRTPLYLPLDELTKKLDLEILRAKRHQNALTLISIEFQDFLHSVNLMPKNLASSLLKDVVNLTNHSLRKNDNISLKNGTQLIILLPQTHQNIAKIIGHKILHDLESFNDKIHLEMKLASYPEDGINSEEIINVLDLGLEKLNEKI